MRLVLNGARRVKRLRRAATSGYSSDTSTTCTCFTIGDLLTYQADATEETTRQLRAELPRRWRLCESTLSALPHGLNTLPALKDIAVQYEERAAALEKVLTPPHALFGRSR